MADKKVKVKCANCNTDIERTEYALKRNLYFICSPECSAEFQRNTYDNKRTKCFTCGNPVRRNTRKTKDNKEFCTSSCKMKYILSSRIDDNNPNNFRARALYYHGEKCMNHNCKLKTAGIAIPKSMLDVHHIDKNRGNNKLNNLAVLCVWCHREVHRSIGTLKLSKEQ